MPVMKTKLIQDFFEADEVKRLIIKKQVDIDPGVEIFNNMIKGIEEDIETMDKEAKKLLDVKKEDLVKINKERKVQIKKSFEVNDSVDERNRDRKLLMEDYLKCNRELLYIQNLAYERGWFD